MPRCTSYSPRQIPVNQAWQALIIPLPCGFKELCSSAIFPFCANLEKDSVQIVLLVLGRGRAKVYSLCHMGKKNPEADSKGKRAANPITFRDTLCFYHLSKM